MAGGWAKDGAVQEQIDASVEDAVNRARQGLGQGESFEFCQDCEEEIPAARREAMRGVRLCVECQELSDRQSITHGSMNRRGSKDSQLR